MMKKTKKNPKPLPKNQPLKPRNQPPIKMPKDHPFWNSPDRPIAIAHRGGAGALGAEKHKQENTIKTFKNVWDMGYRYIELDVISTSDKKVIVIHVAKNRWDRLAHQKDKPNAKLLQTMTH